MSATMTTADEAQLRELNTGYIRAFLTEDAAWYDANLADDFICIRTDGALWDRDAFLAATKPGSAAAKYELSEVSIRIHGDSACVSALGTWERHDGTTGQTRYIDSYARIDGAWKAVSAQLTRLAT